MRISDWSSDVCSSDLQVLVALQRVRREIREPGDVGVGGMADGERGAVERRVDPPPGAAVGRGDGLVALPALREIGRASCRGRGCQYVKNSGVSATFKKKQSDTNHLNSHKTNLI